MDRNRRSVRHLEPKDDVNRTPTADSFRASTVDSGRGSLVTSVPSTTLDSRAATGTSSALSRDTPLDGHENTAHQEGQDDEPIRIHRTPVLGKRCYEQAYVSHIDHPSAFFLQLAHYEKDYKELHEKIKEYYSKKPITNPPRSWKRGEYCIAKDSDNEFYRARIIEVPEVTKTRDIYDVVFLDYGNWDKVASTNIHMLLPKFATLTAQAIPCSLNRTLPRSLTWFDHPEAMKLFDDLVLNQFVDATFLLKSSSVYWQLNFVDLKISGAQLNVREQMKDRNLIREVPNEEIYQEFSYLLKPVDYYIYSISHEGEENNDDDDDHC